MSEVLKTIWYDIKELPAGAAELAFFDSNFTIAEYYIDENNVARWRFRRSMLEDKKIVAGAVGLEANEPDILRGSYCEIRWKNEKVLHVASDIIESIGYAFPWPVVITDIAKTQVRIVWEKVPVLPGKGKFQLKFKVMGQPIATSQ